MAQGSFSDLGHIDTNSLPLGANLFSCEKNVDPPTAAQVDHRFPLQKRNESVVASKLPRMAWIPDLSQLCRRQRVATAHSQVGILRQRA